MRLEAAGPVEADRKDPKIIQGFAKTHQITPEVFKLIRDDTDYSMDTGWVPPVLPKTLADVQGADSN